jgi:hypothetical protein
MAAFADDSNQGSESGRKQSKKKDREYTSNVVRINFKHFIDEQRLILALHALSSYLSTNVIVSISLMKALLNIRI